jgi:hypothetical protein
MQKVYETERLILKVLDSSYAELVLDYYLRNKLFFKNGSLLEMKFFTQKSIIKKISKRNYPVLKMIIYLDFGCSKRMMIPE